MINEKRIQLTKSFLAHRIEASLRKYSDIMSDGKGNEFKYLKQQDYFRIIEDLQEDVHEYLSESFWNKDSIK